jgi:hypothetical protein
VLLIYDIKISRTKTYTSCLVLCVFSGGQTLQGPASNHYFCIFPGRCGKLARCVSLSNSSSQAVVQHSAPRQSPPAVWTAVTEAAISWQAYLPFSFPSLPGPYPRPQSALTSPGRMGRRPRVGPPKQQH